MNWYKIFYWLTVADNVKTVTGWLTIMFAIFVLLGMSFFLKMWDNDGWEHWSKQVKRLFVWDLLLFTAFINMWMFLPSKKDTMLIIAGGSVGTFITSDSSSRALPADLTRFLHLKLNAELEDLGADAKREIVGPSSKDKFTDKLEDLTKEQIIDLLKKDTTVTVK